MIVIISDVCQSSENRDQLPKVILSRGTVIDNDPDIYRGKLCFKKGDTPLPASDFSTIYSNTHGYLVIPSECLRILNPPSYMRIYPSKCYMVVDIPQHLEEDGRVTLRQLGEEGDEDHAIVIDDWKSLAACNENLAKDAYGFLKNLQDTFFYLNEDHYRWKVVESESTPEI